MTQDLDLPAPYQGRDDEDELRERYEEMLFEPGEAIGVVGAQSISEPATQMTMETYHQTGAAAVSITLGLPRLIEIVDARKNPKTPIMNVYLDEDHRDEESVRDVAAKLQATTLADLIASDSLNIGQLELTFELDEDRLEEFRFTPEEVADTLRDKLRGGHIERDGHTITAYPDEEDYDLTDLQELKEKAMEKRLKGLKGVEQVVLTQEDDEWKIQTAGVNLRKTLKVEGVDATRTTCNDFFEILKVLGVEAAREMILRELRSTLEEQGMNVDVRWLLMIADTMTKDGDVKGATRYGVVGAKNSVLARAAFEETKSHLTDAALHGEVDPLDSVIENIIVGQVVPVGTGRLDLTAAPGTAEPAEDPTVPMEPESQVPEDRDVDYEELVDGTVDEVKERVRDDEAVDPATVLEAEQAGKDRVTLTEWLEGRIEADEEAAEGDA